MQGKVADLCVRLNKGFKLLYVKFPAPLLSQLRLPERELASNAACNLMKCLVARICDNHVIAWLQQCFECQVDAFRRSKHNNVFGWYAGVCGADFFPQCRQPGRFCISKGQLLPSAYHLARVHLVVNCKLQVVTPMQ
ncbi:TPA: hypothetical protein ACH3X2_003877 [Trebouxia sp. C0005]